MASGLFKPATRAHAALAAVLLALAFIVPASALIVSGMGGGRGEADQDAYHLKAIERFSAEWPRFDLSDYESATTPGYHLILAAVHRFITTDVNELRLAASLFTVGFFLTLGWALARRLGVAPALALGAPLVASLYVFSSGAWLLPDNLAWWGVLCVLLLAQHPRLERMGHMFVVGGAVLAALVLVRQIHLWAAAMIWLAAWLGSGPNASAVRPLDLGKRVPRAIWAFLATVPAMAIVGYFYWLWGGLAPKMFQPGGAAGHDVTGANLATPALILALVGIYATFYASLLWPAIRAGLLATAQAKIAFTITVVIGVAVAVVPQTTFDMEAGRWSGVWNIVRFLEGHGLSFADRSPLIIALAGVGAAWLAVWALALNTRDRWIFVGAWVAFTAAQTASHYSWQRYYEPFILIMLALFAARLPGTGGGGWARSLQPPNWAVGAWAGPVVLAVLLAAVTVLSLR